MTAHGGPQPESTIEYSIKSDSIASVSSGGLINALGLGVTTVIGKAVGLGADSGMVVYSQVGDLNHKSGILCLIILIFTRVLIKMYRRKNESMFLIAKESIHELSV